MPGQPLTSWEVVEFAVKALSKVEQPDFSDCDLRAVFSAFHEPFHLLREKEWVAALSARIQESSGQRVRLEIAHEMQVNVHTGIALSLKLICSDVNGAQYLTLSPSSRRPITFGQHLTGEAYFALCPSARPAHLSAAG